MKQLFYLLLVTLMLVGCGKDQKKEEKSNNSSGFPEVDRISRLIEKRPEDPQLYFQRAEAYYNNGLYDLSTKDAQYAIELDSSRWEYHHLLADALLDNAQSKEALNALEYYLQINPKRVPSWLKLTEFQYILRQYDEALRSINEIVQLDPQEAEAYFMLGKVLQEQGEKDEALNAYQTAVEMDSGLADAWLSLGNLLIQDGNPKALRYLDNGLAVNPGNTALMQSKGYALQQLGRMQEAVQVFDRIISNDPQNAEAQFNKGVVLLKIDSLEKAEESFKIAQKLEPANHLFYLNRGFTLEQMGNYTEALIQYEQANRLSNGKDERVLESIALIKSKINENK